MHPALACGSTDDCGGYFADTGDGYTYRYYTMGPWNDGKCTEMPDPEAGGGAPFFPHTPKCLKGCCPAGATCSVGSISLPTCAGSQQGTTATFVAGQVKTALAINSQVAGGVSLPYAAAAESTICCDSKYIATKSSSPTPTAACTSLGACAESVSCDYYVSVIANPPGPLPPPGVKAAPSPPPNPAPPPPPAPPTSPPVEFVCDTTCYVWIATVSLIACCIPVFICCCSMDRVKKYRTARQLRKLERQQARVKATTQIFTTKGNASGKAAYKARKAAAEAKKNGPGKKQLRETDVDPWDRKSQAYTTDLDIEISIVPTTRSVLPEANDEADIPDSQ